MIKKKPNQSFSIVHCTLYNSIIWSTIKQYFKQYFVCFKHSKIKQKSKNRTVESIANYSSTKTINNEIYAIPKTLNINCQAHRLTSLCDV